MKFVKTNTGKEFNVFYCGDVGNMLFIEFIGYSFGEIAIVFEDENEIQKIEYYFDVGRLGKTYTGYTVFADLAPSDNGITLTLKKPEQ